MTNMKKTGVLRLSLFSLVLSVTVVFLLVFTATAEQSPTLTSHIPEAVASGVAPLVGHLPSTQRLSLAVSLPLRNRAELDDLIEQIYNPNSPSYRHYLSVQEFTERFGPVEADYSQLIRFAENNGLTVVHAAPNRMVLDLEGSVADIESAFHVNMNLYQHPTEGRTFYSADREPALELAVPVLHITGLDNFTLPHAKNIKSAAQSAESAKTTGSGPGGQFIGSDMRAAYYGSGPLNGTGQVVGLFELGGYEVSDVKLFFKTVKQPLNVPIKGVSVNGANLNCPPQSCDDSEQVLDIEMAISMAPGLKQVLVYVGNNNVSIYNRIATDNIAKQVSCSWGWADNESSLDPIFLQMKTQGQTNFVATGDQGSSTAASVVWPSDDPYVIAVGGTDLVTNGPGGSWKSETGWSGSAGMPSKNRVPIPSYQKLAGVITTLNKGSKTLRNIPDVAAESNTNQFSCFDGSCNGGNGGTSYAAPQWAGFTAMINQQAAAKGKGPVGFFNPAIYAIGTGSSYHSDFHDIVKGSNGQFSAVTNFDLVTGWGSPTGPNLINALAGGADQ
jgi:subtilase family serine protease